jgi:class 3 adenylate cyclase
VLCPRCSHDNPATNRFCAECGAELTATCPSCATANPPGAKFCAECGTALHGTSSAPPAGPGRAERRFVSVLFADLVGFTPFSETRDPEEVRGLLTTYFDRCREIVERFGGSVDKFIGDAVMAVWGAVGAREDDAERSVRAGLELVDMVSGLGAEIGVPDLALRAGVMTGETSVGPGGNEKGLVVGDLVNTASRLQSIATPGSVVVGEPTRALAAAAIAFDELGAQTLKGKATPVPAFRARRVISERGGARRAQRIEPPFTGRDVELRMLKDQFHATGRDRSARLISVVGEAGIGKTRLSWELEKYIDGLAESVYWHRGRSPSYGEGLTMWALGEMVRSRSGISDEDDAAKSRLKLRTAVAQYVTSEEDRRWLEPRLAALLGLETVPSGDRAELYGAFRTFFHYISDLGTTVLVFEDMHWADAGLLDFVTELVERSPRHPIFVVTLARPELLAEHPGFGSGHHNFISLHLAPLSDTSMGELIRGMIPGISDDAALSLVERAGGIPMYAVEFVRMLLGSGELVEDAGAYVITGSIDHLALPESLQAVVGARLDRLPPADRELIQDAAVLGQSFTADGLAIVRDGDVRSIAGDLAPLVRNQLLEVDDDPRSPERGQYRFVQSVIREVAYGRLSRADRYARHLKVAEYFEGLEDTELVGAVASHYLAAHDAAPAGEGEGLLLRGRTALSDAAVRASDLRSHEAALSLLGQALELSTSAEDRAPLLERASLSAAWASHTDRSVALAAEAARLYEQIGDEGGRMRAITMQAFTMSSNFRADESIALLAPVYDAIGDPTSVDEVALALETARAYMLNMDNQTAVEIGDRIMARAEKILPPDQVIDGIITRATALGSIGRRMEALALLTGAVTLADEHQLQAQAIRAINNHQVTLHFDAPGVSRESLDEFIARSRRFGAAAWLNRALWGAALALIDHGDLPGAEEKLDELESFELNDFEAWMVRYIRALIAALREGTAEHLREVWEAASVWDDSTDAQLQGYANGFKAGAKLLEGDPSAALEHALLASSPGSALDATFCALALEDPTAIERARAHVEAVGDGGRVARACGMLLDAGSQAIGGDPAGAAAGFIDAIDLLERIADPFWVVTARALFSGLVGDAHPEAQRSGTEALRWLRGAGIRRFEVVWADWLPSEAIASDSA